MAQGFSSENYTVFNFTSSNGLPQNTVSMVRQDNDGFIWVSTLGGVVRFDGSAFKSYGLRDIKGLKSDFVLDVYVDAKNRIWIVTEHELLCIDHRQTILRQHPTSQFEYPIRFAASGDRLFLMFGKSIYFIDDTGYKKVYTTSSSLIWLQGTKKYIYFTESGYNGLKRLSENGVETLLKTPEQIREVCEFQDTIYYSIRNTFYKLKSDTKPERIASFGTILNEDSFAVRMYAPNGFYYTKGPQFLIMDAYGQHQDCLLNMPKNYHSFDARLFRDREKNLWMQSPGSGLFLLCPKIAKRFGKMKSKNGEVLLSGTFIYKDPFSDSLWTDAHGFTLASLKYSPAGLSGDIHTLREPIWCMLIDKQRNHWYGDGTSGIFRCNGINQQCKDISIVSKNDKKFRTLFQTSDGDIWTDTYDGPYRSHDGRTFELVREAASIKAVQQFYEHPSTGLWIASQTGLANFKNNKWTFYNTSCGLPTNDIRSVYVDKDNVVWIGTAGFGLCRMKQGNTSLFPVKNDQINPNIWAIIEDDYGYLWMSSNQGIYSVNKNDLNKFADGNGTRLEARHYTEEDGLDCTEFNSRTQNKGFRANDGAIWFSSIRGPVRIDTRKAWEISRRQIRNIIIDEVYLDNEPQEWNEKGLDLEGTKHSVQFRFSMPSFYGQQTAHFEYKLEGIQNTWTDIDGRSFVLNNIPGGQYKLRIRLVGSEHEATMPLCIHPFIYEMLWVRILMALLVASLPFMIILQLWKKRQRKKDHEREKELEMANLKLSLVQMQMNPHFIYNVLGSIQSYVARSEPYKASDYIAKFARLIRLTLNHAGEKQVSVYDELSRLNIYLELEKLRHGERLNYEIDIASTVDLTITIPNMLIQPLLENAIIHGILQMEPGEKGLLKLSIRKSGQFLVIEVDDNGVGFNPDSASKHGYGSIGVSGIRHVISHIQGASFSIINKAHVNMAFRGTLVTIKLPLAEQ